MFPVLVRGSRFKVRGSMFEIPGSVRRAGLGFSVQFGSRRANYEPNRESRTANPEPRTEREPRT
jgi:hypothetical protein